MECIIIIHPPKVRYTENFETVEYVKCVSNLSKLQKQHTNWKLLAENTLMLTGVDVLGMLQDVVEILPEGTIYTYTILNEQPQWIDKEKVILDKKILA